MMLMKMQLLIKYVTSERLFLFVGRSVSLIVIKAALMPQVQEFNTGAISSNIYRKTAIIGLLP